MIKNMEWGAVAYLSHSKYGTCIDGTCTEIGINNNYNNMTGCGAIAGSSSSSTCNAYNTTTGMLASTTQNIYGVYDMSGGVHELTMANIVNTDGTTMIPGDSEYTTTTYPDAKYYDKYVRVIQVINYAKYFRINFIRNGKAYYADSRDKTLFYSIHRLNHFPINFKITKYDWRIYTKNRKENIKPQT